MSSAEQLKEEGNLLFVAKKYAEAAEKYSAAIEQDPLSAVFYANRAACYLNLKKYIFPRSSLRLG
jgi:tetratricopeptide (TPR) repeat protein